MEKRFKELFYILKNNIALRQFSKILELEDLNGAYDECKDVLQGSKQQYNSTLFVREALHCIASVIRLRCVIDRIAARPTHGMMYCSTKQPTVPIFHNSVAHTPWLLKAALKSSSLGWRNCPLEMRRQSRQLSCTAWRRME